MANKMRNAFARTLIIALLLTISFVSVPTPEAFAASGNMKKGKIYDVVVKGKYAYCSTFKGVYKVNLKTGSKKRFVKGRNLGYLKVCKGYLYYKDNDGIAGNLYRIKLSGKGKKKLANVINYAIVHGKIYYTTSGGISKCMKLNGKSKKKSNYQADMRWKASNKKGYRVKKVIENQEFAYDYEYGDEYLVSETDAEYLVTPSGKRIKLCVYSF